VRAFFANILVPKNLKTKTQLCNFWRKHFVQKHTLKMLVKLTPDDLLVSRLKFGELLKVNSIQRKVSFSETEEFPFRRKIMQRAFLLKEAYVIPETTTVI